MKDLIFMMLISSKKGEKLSRIAVQSLRTFGGILSNAPIWIFVNKAYYVNHALSDIDGVEWFPLKIDQDFPAYPFAEKVCACAHAEAMAGIQIRSLVWLSLDCLILNPPLLFDLKENFGYQPADVAFRPVHHRNIGALANEPLDSYWSGIYQKLEITEMHQVITSYVDGQVLHPYFNTHCFAYNPEIGLAEKWWQAFQAMVMDRDFQAASCQDSLHKIFLHQAILSALVPIHLPWNRVRLLPPEYNFPLNLLDQIADDEKPKNLNHLVNAVYEDTFPWEKIDIEEPLFSWLKQRL